MCQQETKPFLILSLLICKIGMTIHLVRLPNVPENDRRKNKQKYLVKTNVIKSVQMICSNVNVSFQVFHMIMKAHFRCWLVNLTVLV